MTFTNDDCLIQGHAVPPELLGRLRESDKSDVNSCRANLEEDGYVLLRGMCDPVQVLAARKEVFERLVAVDEISAPAVAGIATGRSRRKELAGDLGSFWKSVSEGFRLRAVSHGPSATAMLSLLLGEDARPHEYLFLRPSVVGRATRLHYDQPFFARGSSRIVTAWTALGDIPTCDGALVVVEGSHRFADLIEPILEIDYDGQDSPQVQLSGDAVEFAANRNARLLTTDFRGGDCVVFSMTTMHGTLDNHSPICRTRLSCDVRWQPSSDPLDLRYFGPTPSGTTGLGYAELNGAKPLTEDWHTR